MFKYTLKSIKGDLVLHKNDLPCECPFKTGAAAQDQFGQIALINQACSTKCPHIEISEYSKNSGIAHRDEAEKVKNEASVILTCGSRKEFKATIIEESPIKLVN